MILVFSILILRARARAGLLAAGIVASLSGILLAVSVNSGGWLHLAEALVPPPLSFALGLAGAVCWCLYSVLARVFRQSNSSGAVAIFLLVAGGVSLTIALSGGSAAALDGSLPSSAIAIAAAAYMALLPNSLAYWFWDIAIRDGDVPTLGALANLIPVLSAAIGTLAPSEPGIEIVDVSGMTRTVALSEIRGYAIIERQGAYQNQFGNWGGDGVYTGALLRDLVGDEYHSVVIVAADGYRVAIERHRVEDPAYPIVLAYCVDCVCVPDLSEGFRIAVLPEDGSVSNAEYGVESAGSYWVRGVVRIELE